MTIDVEDVQVALIVTVIAEAADPKHITLDELAQIKRAFCERVDALAQEAARVSGREG